MNNYKIAFVITLLAGLSTILGSLIVFLFKKKTNRILSLSLSFASGVMLSISLFDLIPESYHYLSILLNNNYLIKIILFIIIGFILTLTISIIIDKYHNKSDIQNLSILSIIVIILHNIPEGIATFITTTTSIKLGLKFATAISLHNIPEGILTSIPVYYSTNKKRKAILYTFISGIAEFIGALLTYFILYRYISDELLGILFAFIAGMMIYISIIELIPLIIKYKTNNREVVLSFLFGVLLIIINLFVL